MCYYTCIFLYDSLRLNHTFPCVSTCPNIQEATLPGCTADARAELLANLYVLLPESVSNSPYAEL